MVRHGQVAARQKEHKNEAGYAHGLRAVVAPTVRLTTDTHTTRTSLRTVQSLFSNTLPRPSWRRIKGAAPLPETIEVAGTFVAVGDTGDTPSPGIHALEGPRSVHLSYWYKVGMRP